MKLLAFIFVSVSLFLACRAQSTDLTLVPGAIGEDVVDATIAKIEALNVFPNDLDLLKRIALVESNFGTNITDPQGGIWQISPQIYSQISAPANRIALFSFIAPATLEFGSSITNLSNPDFSIPLRSALAARLYIELVERLGSTDDRGTVSAQATWWSNNYNLTGDPMNFENFVTNYENSQNCTIARLDMWILIDGSGSIGENNFKTTLQFVANFSSEFVVAEDAVRVGFSVYNGAHTFYSMFDEDTNNTQLINKVLSTSYPGGGTRTGSAIRHVVNTGFQETNGLRPLSAGVPRVLIVLTDGRSHDNVLIPSNEARNEDITVYAVGIGQNIDPVELDEIANDASRVFQLADFSELLTVLRNQLNQGACAASATIPDNTTVQVRVTPGNTYHSTVQLPNNGSVTLEFFLNATSIRSPRLKTLQAGVVYGSASISQPNAALNDFSAVLQPGRTVLTINSRDDGASPVLAGVPSRLRRSIGNTAAPSKPLYIALQSTSTETLDLEFQSTPSLVRAAVRTANTTSATNTTAQPMVETTVQSVAATTGQVAQTTGTMAGTTASGTRHNTPYDASMLFVFILILRYL